MAQGRRGLRRHLSPFSLGEEDDNGGESQFRPTLTSAGEVYGYLSHGWIDMDFHAEEENNKRAQPIQPIGYSAARLTRSRDVREPKSM